MAKMDSNIKMNLVIGFYEEEESNLLRLISESIEEEEFNSAKYHTRALNLVRTKLYELKCLYEENFREKYYLQMRLAGAQKALESEQRPEFKSLVLRRIELMTEKLQHFNRGRQFKDSNVSSSLLCETLLALLSNQIGSFSLVVDKKTNLKFQFKKKGKICKTIIPNVKSVLPDYLKDIDYASQFSKQDFLYSRNRIILTLTIGTNKEQFAHSLITTISQLCFEVFGAANNGLESFIVIDELGKGKRNKPGN